MTKEPKFVAQTLAWCNRQRNKKGEKPLKKLPRGTRADGWSCPCGKATGLFVNFTYYHARGDKRDKKTPSYVAEFIDNLDNGRLPQYEAK